MNKKILLILILLLSFVLRFYKLGENPPSLSWDEASLGYNAYSISTSGQDEHGELFPLARFIAFGDYKPPGYIYADSISVKIFNLSEWSIRLPSAIAGLLMVVFTYLLVLELFQSKNLSLLSAFIMAISPWSLQFSRAAYESNLAALFNLIAIYLFFLSLRRGSLYLLSTIFFIFSFYTFNANRIIAPLMLFSLSIVYIKTLFKNKLWLIVSIIISSLLLLPSFSYLKSKESKLRFQEVSIFNNLNVIETANDWIAKDGNTSFSKIIHNRRILYLFDFLKHYSDNFSGRFLFTHGDVNPRLSIQEMGELYIWDLPFLVIGLYLLYKHKEKGLLPIMIWMLIVPIPAGTARETPHALRILSILPTYQMIIAYGLYRIILFLRQKSNAKFFYSLLLVTCLALVLNFYYYLHNYYVHYPVSWSGEWQYGYKEMVSYVSDVEGNYDSISITDSLGRPYIYFALYNKYPVNKFLQERKASRDWFGFWNVSSLGKIQFGLDDLSNAEGRVLLVTTPGNLPGSYHLLTNIKNLSGDEVFLIAER